MTDDPYVYPGTNVLRNALGIRDAARLRRIDADITRLRIARLAARKLPGAYDLAHLQAFHRALFEGLYDWAGEVRTVVIAKTDLFCLPQHIASYADAVFGALARDGYLVGLELETFVARLGHHLGEVNALHPVRDGNGRAQRVFFGQLAVDAGYWLDWRRVEPERNADASMAAMRGDARPLRDLLLEVTRPLGHRRA